jgi:hypothetical protein
MSTASTIPAWCSPSGTGPHSETAARKIEDLLRGAGFTQVRIETLDLDPPVACVLAVNPDPGTASGPGAT